VPYFRIGGARFNSHERDAARVGKMHTAPDAPQCYGEIGVHTGKTGMPTQATLRLSKP
jgi:hypothetical protein